jgi:hypothetical protein
MRTTAALLVLLGMTTAGRGADPAVTPPPEVRYELPPGMPPGMPPNMLPGPLPPLGYYRVSAYEVWQNLAVNQQGYWRARVIDTPYGAFYRYNGQPFPWTTTQQYLYTPVITGAPYRLMPYATD